MRRYFSYSILAAFSLLFIGCEKLLENDSDKVQSLTVNATYDNVDSKAIVLDGGTLVYWELEDEINVFCGQAYGKLVSTNMENSKTAAFTGIVSGEVNPSARNKLFALYPYREDASFDDGVITTTLPEVQTAVAGSFDRDANIAIAASESTDLVFGNVCGGLRFTLKNSGIKRIVFESNGGEYIAGEFSAQFEDGVPVVKEIKNGSSKVTLGTEDGSAFETGVLYYMSFLPTTLKEGYTVTFISDTKSAIMKVDREQAVRRCTYGTISDIDKNLKWAQLEQYDYVIATDLADWDNACFGKYGELIMLKDYSGVESSGKAYMLLPSETNGLDEFYTSFGENDIPEMVYINGMSIKVLSIQDGLADVLVNFSDSLSVCIDSLSIQELSSTKSFSENNGVRNACAIARLVLGAVEGGAGTLMVGVSGASIPLTKGVGVAGVISGASTFRDGYDNVSKAYATLFAPATESYRGNWSDVIVSAGESKFEDGLNRTLEACASEGQSDTFNNIKIFKGQDIGKLKKASSVLSLIGRGIDFVDNIFGKTVTERDRALMKYSGFSVITGVLKDKGANWATVSAYVGPDPYYYCSSWECGIILNGSDGSHTHYNCPLFNYFEHTFRGLKRSTGYEYQAYFHDKEHGFGFFGQQQSFETERYSLSKVIDFEQTNATMGSYSYEGHTYKYKFECTITVNLNAINEHDAQVEDWGYVYKDPRGNIAKISLDGHSSPYRDFRYVFYRDESSSTACLYGYVKYTDEDCLYDEPYYYPLVYKGGEGCPDANHVHAIDLGLSVKWACCNVGATKPEGYGGYYAWGETEEKSYYHWNTYRWGSDYDELSKYCTDSSYGTVDGRTTLEPSDDVAHVKWGGSWRMPTEEEFFELYVNCESEWTILNGVYGRKFTSSKNGNSIFLPAAGYRVDGRLDNAGSDCVYCSSSLFTYPHCAATSGFNSGSGATVGGYRRCSGQSVRPVSE